MNKESPRMLTRGSDIVADEAAFVHPTALLSGKVRIGRELRSFVSHSA
jgi:carbonic anhydrase/acetyltransferase-like protein (isoleucine patch superfamily)